MEKINNKVGNSESYVSDLKELNKTAKKTSMKIDDYKESISSMEENLKSMKNETLNVDGKFKNIFFIIIHDLIFVKLKMYVQF